MKAALLTVALAVAGCSQFPYKDVVEHEVAPRALMAECGPGVVGCFRPHAAVCDIYMLPVEYWIKHGPVCMYYAVKAHEERHCSEGWFHGESANALPYSPAPRSTNPMPALRGRAAGNYDIAQQTVACGEGRG